MAQIFNTDVVVLGSITAESGTNATHTGDVTGATVLTIADNAVNNNKLADMPTSTLKGRKTSGTGNPEDLTSAEATAILDLFTDTNKGLVPPPNGASNRFLRGDGVWEAPPGGGSPGGSSNQVQYNSAGSFAGASKVNIENDNLKLITTADPTPPASDGIILYGASYASRLLPKIIGPTGIDTALQVGLHGNAVMLITPTNGTAAPGIIGGTLTTIATMSSQITIASANRWQATYRKRFQTSKTAGNTSGMRTAYTQYFRGNAAGFGGFFFRAQLGMNINLNGGQKFVGLCASTAALAGEPSALINMCGMGYDSTDSYITNWFFMRNDSSGSATKVDLGINAARNITHGFDLIMFLAPNSGVLYVKITNLHTNTIVLDTSYSTDIPAANVGMAFKAEVRNGAAAAADDLEIAKIYIETDF